MINFEISILPLILIAVLNFFISWIYYSPITPWFKTWCQVVGVSPEKEFTAEDKKRMPFLMGGAVIGSFLLSIRTSNNC